MLAPDMSKVMACTHMGQAGKEHSLAVMFILSPPSKHTGEMLGLV